jgi:hypothetical protein
MSQMLEALLARTPQRKAEADAADVAPPILQALRRSEPVAEVDRALYAAMDEQADIGCVVVA